MKKTKKQEFFEELTNHYIDFATDISPVVKSFAKLKRKYPKEIELLNDFQRDANSKTFTEGLTYEEKGKFYELMLRCSDLSTRFQRFYSLSVKELKQLERDLLELQKRI